MSAANTGHGIAVVGIGCWYPGAKGPRELWENIVARRREFRRLPDCRLPLGEYHDPDATVPDKTYGRRAGVIDGFKFDWAGRRIPKATYENTDVVQWLALEVALQAVADAGYDAGKLPRDRTGVIVGNTLTGEHTRAQSMRLRWPFIKKTLLAAAAARGLAPEAAGELAATMEGVFKSVFSPITEDTLAGGLSNTIPGRICNFLDLHGGGYTVDGACSSSLLAVCTAADRLTAGDLDVALAGGVDVSLDTFELIGFAKTGALTADDMRVYDKKASGFLPGEGCGFVVLKRLADARAAGDPVLAVLRGWGVSSDGKGGLTAPSREGQATALRRAYQKAGYGADQLDFIEGHGTGTRVGDKVELEAIAAALAEAGVTKKRACGVTSLKSIVGHTKAAAGVGAFIKAVMAVNRRVIPATAGCSEFNPVLDDKAATVYPVLQGEVRPANSVVRAGISAMGFGGINAHCTLESGDGPAERLQPMVEERALLASSQESELFVLGANTIEELREKAVQLAETAEPLSLGDLTDLAARLAEQLPQAPPVRAAVVASTPEELVKTLAELADRLDSNPPKPGETARGPRREWWVGHRANKTRLGFLFPGQGSQQINAARTLVERFAWARELVAKGDEWLKEVGAEPVSQAMFRPLDRAADDSEKAAWAAELAKTDVAQPAICLASLLLHQHLANLGLIPAAVGGHSLGELTAFHAAGAFDAESLIKLAGLRGRAMAAAGKAAGPGTMASLACPAADAERLIAGLPGYVTVANRNSPKQTVISGDESAVRAAVERAAAAGVTGRMLPVSGAFHSRLVAAASDALRREAELPEGQSPKAKLFSSTDGLPVPSATDLREHFATQIVRPVDFVALATNLARECDVLVEVGPGRVLSGLAADTLGESGPVCLPVASTPGADRDLHAVAAAAFVGGVEVKFGELYCNRLVRPFVPADQRLFIDNPCERPLAVPPATLPIASGPSLATSFADGIGCSPTAAQKYLDRRLDFLVAVAKADLRSQDELMEDEPETPPFVPMQPAVPEPEPAPPAPMPERGPDIAALILAVAAKRTGYPAETIDPAAKLLDDLNLDSIKAAELVAEAAKQAGVAGKVDPSKLANASLSEVAAAIAAVLGNAGPTPTDTPVTMSSEAVEASWVREFAIEFVAEAA
jgi:enediyne polyketide synthase